MIFGLLKHFCSCTIVCSFKRLKSSKTRFNTTKMQVFTQKKNPLTGSTEWDVQHEDYDYHQEIARSAFADMLHDTERNKKYFRALQAAIKKMHADGKKANVLDIGTGTGLLSIMAVRCGADSIVACEAFKPMAECCKKILKRNGVTDQITVIHKRSTELTVGEDGDMKERANILVTEVFDTELIGEGALPTFAHAHKYLLEEDCIVIPDSAVIYAQLVECPTLQKWNKLNDLADEDCGIVLRTPQKMKSCAGSAAVHDLQLSQIPRQAFQELTEPVPIFYYDWSGRTPIEMRRTVKQDVVVTGTGQAQMVFMWWELNMDTQGKIVLSCAPWWAHPDAEVGSERPQDTIPWRDHWMQAVYYLPKELPVKRASEATLVACQDEYSLWFYLEDQNNKHMDYKRPICECGVHMAMSRTQVSYLNDGKRSKMFLARIKEELTNYSVVLDLNGNSFYGLAAAKLGAKKVYILENMNIQLNILSDYAAENGIKNVTFISELNDHILNESTYIFCDPCFSSAILPWENLKCAYIMYKYRERLEGRIDKMTIIPEACEFWAMPVEFQDLHKIRVPLGKCEGIDMGIFDKLVEKSRIISDAEIEAQPLWEYPCRSRGAPRRLLAVDLRALRQTYANDDIWPFQPNQRVNGFALWAVWKVGGKEISCGPTAPPTVGERVAWDPHTRQAVKLLEHHQTVSEKDSWGFQVVCDLEKGQFNIKLDINFKE